MSASTSIKLIALLLLGILTGVSVAEEKVRTWTDKGGKTLEAKMLFLTPDDKIVLESDGQSYSISINRFSDEDQEYARGFEERKNAGDQPSPGTRRSRDNDKRKDLEETRVWTDTHGMEIKAKYIRMHEGHVVLLQGKTGHKVPFYVLSAEDQEYLREALVERGEDDKIWTREQLIAEFPLQYGPGGSSPLPAAPTPVVTPSPNALASNQPTTPAYSPSNDTPAYVPPENPPYVPSDDVAMNNTPSGNQGAFTPPSEANGNGHNSDNPSYAPSNDTANNQDSGSSGLAGRFNSGGTQAQGDGAVPLFGLPEKEPWYAQYKYALIAGAVVVALALLNMVVRKD